MVKVKNHWKLKTDEIDNVNRRSVSISRLPSRSSKICLLACNL